MSALDFDSLTPAEQRVLLDGPSLAPPTGTISNFNNPLNENRVAYAIVGLCLGLSTVFLFLRAYATFTYLKGPYLSDYVITVGYIFHIAICSTTLVESNYLGLFVHMWDIRLRDLPHMLYLFLVGSNLFAIASGFIKAAIILEWLRIFVPGGTRNTFFWAAHIILWVNGILNVVALIVFNLTCVPHEKIWNRLMVPGNCIKGHAVEITGAATNLGVDLLILLLPQRVIWALRISTNKRIRISAVFAVGLLGCVAASFRLVESIQYAISPDVTYTFSALSLAAIGETTAGILVFSVPTAPKAFAALGRLTSFVPSRTWSDRSSRDGKPFPPRSGRSKRSKPWPYEELDDSRLISTSTLGPGAGRSGPFVSIHEPIQAEDTQASTLRTTYTGSTESEHVDGIGNTNDCLNRQHSWDAHAYQRTNY